MANKTEDAIQCGLDPTKNERMTPERYAGLTKTKCIGARSNLVFAMSTGIDAAVVIKPLIMLAIKCSRMFSLKYPTHTQTHSLSRVVNIQCSTTINQVCT